MLLFARRRRRKLRAAPFPPEWLDILHRCVPVYARLSAPDQEELRDLVKVFVGDKRFLAGGSMQITDEVRVTVAALACLLLLRREIDEPYPTLSTIVVHPHVYAGTRSEVEEGGITSEVKTRRAGEAWLGGPVVLAWDALVRGAADPADGDNVVLHELAHVLDGEDGSVNGAPVLDSRRRYAPWARVLQGEYDRLRAGKPTLIDAYGGTSPAEFFAVATEAFFERPREMMKRHPELYAQLRSFYRQDPAQWGR